MRRSWPTDAGCASATAPTRDGGFIVVCSDISLPKQQEAEPSPNQSAARCRARQHVARPLPVRRARTGSRSSTGASSKSSGCRATRSSRAPLSRNPGVQRRQRQSHGKTVDELLAEQRRILHGAMTGTHFYELNDGRVVASVYNPTSDGGWVATYEDVTERRQAEAKIMHMARHDALTDLPNRVLFREKMEQALAQRRRARGVCSSISIASRASTIRSAIPSAMRCCARSPSACSALRARRRYGRPARRRRIRHRADRAAQPTDATRACRAASSRRSAQPFDIDGHQVVIGTSIGIAIAPTDGATPTSCCSNADMALYRAKSDGRGTYHFFEPEMDAQMQARRTLELDLRKALAGRRVRALLPAAGRSREQARSAASRRCCAGTIPSAGWSRRTTSSRSPKRSASSCRSANGCSAGLRATPRRGRQALRSRSTCRRSSSAIRACRCRWCRRLAHRGLPPTRLELEITETVLLQDDQAVARRRCIRLRELGVRIAWTTSAPAIRR